jgi:alpha-tubulin suppressor-like RCC1 family protein
MSGKWPGGFIKKTAPTVVGPVDGEGGSASGIWTLDQAADYEQRGLWPMPTLSRELYAWGNNNVGQIGDGTTTDRSSPVQVGGITWSTVRGPMYGQHVLATKTDGTLWAWGVNGYGQLGNSNTTSYSSPIQVGALTTWSKMTGANQSSAAIKTDGTLWTWGYNGYGILGNGNVLPLSSPGQVGTLTTWSDVSMGGHNTIATKTDGTLWGWGRNAAGALGQGNIIAYSSPVQIGALTTWLQASAGYTCTLAIKTDGTLWAWGNNNQGELGDGTTTARSSPVQVGALTTWLTVSAGLYSTYATKTDGTLWAWGWNNNGQIGNGAQGTNISSPVQVGALTTWSHPVGGYQFTLATKTDGTLWGWGQTSSGQLGNGIGGAPILSPVQIGALTTWKSTGISRSRKSGYGITQG